MDFTEYVHVEAAQDGGQSMQRNRHQHADQQEVIPTHATRTSPLVELLHLSGRLPLDRRTKMTPIMAWVLLLHHERFNEFTIQDIEQVKVKLSRKAQRCRCVKTSFLLCSCICAQLTTVRFSFGAVLENREVRDAIDDVLSPKDKP